ncbi:MAG: aspartate aminotransferase family protein [Bacteroidetes bacterium]|nr:aspartate aminotransferase family protein [Bacteroidota bacterium]
MTNREIFFNHIAQTSLSPPALEIKSANGIYIYGADGKKYFDLISGISVSNLGHGNSKIVSAIKKQLDKHKYVMVYGEFIVSPQVEYANLLVKYLLRTKLRSPSSSGPKNLDNVYFTSSGAEAVEGALKLAKRFTGRTEIIAFKNSYHGSTHGALSVMGNEMFKQAFRPLLPDIRFLEFNNEKDLALISSKTACVIVEPIQGEAGIILPQKNFLEKLRDKCGDAGALLIFDEIQTGMGRTGKLFAFEKYKVVPDILCLAKALGGGMPMGAFISSKKIMSTLSYEPVLGHITTFGGHPLSCAAGIASMKEIVSKKLFLSAEKKNKLFRKLLKHSRIKEIRGEGLLLAIQFSSEKENKKIISKCIENGVITDWFLFRADAMRIAPPIIISEKEIKLACEIILRSIESIK